LFERWFRTWHSTCLSCVGELSQSEEGGVE
jgi:hypothetical protein